MEAVALGEVIKKCVDIAGTLIVEGGSCLYGWREDVQWIQTQLSFMESYMKDADSNPSKREGLSNLRSIIRDLAHDAEDIMDTYFPSIEQSQRMNKKFVGYLKCLYARRYFVMEVQEIRIRVESINKYISTHGFKVNNDGDAEKREEWDSRASFIHQDEPRHVIIGLDRDVEQLKAILLNEDVNYDAVSIVGMPGVGKTTLAKRVFNSANMPHFQCSAMVYVSQDPNITQVFRDIARQVGVDGQEEANLQLNLREFLRGKRYVILFDDIWETKAWDALKTIIPNHSDTGGRVIITSRSSDVGRYISGENRLHELSPLKRVESWELNSNIVMNMNNNHDSAEFENIGRQILERCGDVPLAIVVTAGLLLCKERTESAWRAVLGLMGQQHEEDECSKT